MVLILSMFGGLELDVPGEGVVITAVRPVDEWPGRLRCGGLAHRFLGRGIHGEKLSWKGVIPLMRNFTGPTSVS